MSEISLNAVIVPSTDQVACDVGEETVILGVKDGVYYGLNPVAALVWKCIQDEMKVIEIRDMIIQEYDVEADVCTGDLLALLAQLAAWGLIEVRNGKVNDNAPLESEGAVG